MIKCGDILNVKNKNTCFDHEYRVNQNDFIEKIKNSSSRWIEFIIINVKISIKSTG